MKKTILMILAAALLTSGINVFAYDSSGIDYVKTAGIMEGDEKGNLNPDDYVTRAEMAKIVCKIHDPASSDSTADYSDMQNHWAKEYVQKATAMGSVNGFEDGTFRPDDYVTYEQAIKMLIGSDTWASYPFDYVAFMIENDLLKNVNGNMGECIKRGDVAELVLNLLGALENGELDEVMQEYDFSILLNLYNEKYKKDEEVSENDMSSSGGGGGIFSSSAGGMIIAGSAPSGAMPTMDAASSAMQAPMITAESAYAPVPMPDYSVSINPYMNSESYSSTEENIFKKASMSPLSTFSIDTDTASYSNLRRFALSGQSAAPGAVRTEELINYFDYNLPQPTDGTPFSVVSEVAKCPWNPENMLAMIGVQGEELVERQPQNLVFLLDVSGSMYSYNKLPLMKRSMELLLKELDERDTISIVTYASGVNVLASGVKASEKDKIMSIIDGLRAGGGTYGEGGLQMAYEQAEEFKCEGNNRIILCTDGDFNIGVSDNNTLKTMISEKRDNNIFISVLGFGMGNYKDDKLEIIADNGDGGYYYIDNLREAKKVLSTEMTSTLYTIAKDVKIQVEFNPTQVESYRLIGYENRVLQNEQFEDDTVDAGELGAGANVVALYEIVPAKDGGAAAEGSELRYQTPQYSESGELMDVKLRYKLPTGGDSILKEYPVLNQPRVEESDNFRFAAGVAEVGMLLNNSDYKGSASYDNAMELAKGAVGDDMWGFRREFVQLVDLIRFLNR